MVGDILTFAELKCKSQKLKLYYKGYKMTGVIQAAVWSNIGKVILLDGTIVSKYTYLNAVFNLSSKVRYRIGYLVPM